jgi:hypothetical protein
MARPGLPILTRWVLRTSPNLVTKLDSGVIDKREGIETYYVKLNSNIREFKLACPQGIEIYRAFGLESGKSIFFSAEPKDNEFAYATTIENATVTKAIDTRQVLEFLSYPWYSPRESAKIFERIAYGKIAKGRLDGINCRCDEHIFKRKQP